VITTALLFKGDLELSRFLQHHSSRAKAATPDARDRRWHPVDSRTLKKRGVFAQRASLSTATSAIDRPVRSLIAAMKKAG
jgi:hypothetical protein